MLTSFYVGERRDPAGAGEWTGDWSTPDSGLGNLGFRLVRDGAPPERRG